MRVPIHRCFPETLGSMRRGPVPSPSGNSCKETIGWLKLTIIAEVSLIFSVEPRGVAERILTSSAKTEEHPHFATVRKASIPTRSPILCLLLNTSLSSLLLPFFFFKARSIFLRIHPRQSQASTNLSSFWIINKGT